MESELCRHQRAHLPTKPESSGITRHSQAIDIVAQHMRTHLLGVQRRSACGGFRCTTLDQLTNAGAGDRRPRRLRKTAAPGSRPATRSASACADSRRSGHRRVFPPLPNKVTREWSALLSANCSPPTLSCAASDARAPVWYRNNNKARSRRPCDVEVSGASSKASSSCFSR